MSEACVEGFIPVSDEQGFNPMSVRDRVEDAEQLWANGRKEGAWVQALIAAAATSKKRYAKMSDGNAFRKFISDISVTIMTGTVDHKGPRFVQFYSEDDPRGYVTLEDLFYRELRCNLVHEGSIGNIGLSASEELDNKIVGTLSIPRKGTIRIPEFWVLHLLIAVKEAPENRECWQRAGDCGAPLGFAGAE